MPKSVTQALDNFIERFLAVSSEHSRKIEYDIDWPSPCYRQDGCPGDFVSWQPAHCSPPKHLKSVEKGMELTLHPDLHQYFGQYFSDNIDAKTERGNLQLLFAWNEDDFDRLQQNIIGHLLMKKRLDQDPTVFFAVTDEEDFILTVDNHTGAVMLEQVGLPPSETLASSLAEFIESLTPVTR